MKKKRNEVSFSVDKNKQKKVYQVNATQIQILSQEQYVNQIEK